MSETRTAATTMRAAAYSRFGGADVIEVVRRDRPSPGRDEVVIRVAAATVGSSDAAARSGRPMAARLFAGPIRPRLPILGSDFVGTIVEAGEAVEHVRAGDAVWGFTGARMGTHAEFVRVGPEGVAEPLPDGLDVVSAAALIDATALSFLDDTLEVGNGARLLIWGASGAVGTMAVQLARHRGARVTAVCGAERIDAVKALEADEVLDRADALDTLTGAGRTFDAVFDASGALGHRRARAVLAASGRYATTVPSVGILVRTLATRRSSGRREVIAFTGLRARDAVLADLREIGELAVAGALRPVVAAVYPLESAARAHAHVDAGKCGQVVLDLR